MRTKFKRMTGALAACAMFPTGLFAQWGGGDGSPVLDSILLREAPMNYVAWLLGEAWGKPIVVNEGARDKEISLFLDGISCLSALKAVCHANGLWFQEDPESGIVYVETLEEYVKGSRLNSQKQVEVVTLVYPRAEDVAASLQELFQEMVVYMQPEFQSGDASLDIQRAIARMVQIASMSTLVNEGGAGGAGGGGIGGGIGGGVGGLGGGVGGLGGGIGGLGGGIGGLGGGIGGGFGNNQRGIEATSRFQEEVEELESRPGRVEASASGEPTPLNPGLVYIAAVRQSNTLLLRSSDPDALVQIKRVIEELDRPQAQVLLEVKVLALDVRNEKQRAIDILFGNPNRDVTAGFANGLGDIPATDEDGNPNPFQFGNIGLLEGGFDPRSVVFQAIGQEAQARLRLLDSQGKIERLATPNLMVADLEASRIFVGDETTILTEVNVTTNTTGGDNPVITVQRDPQTERRDIGTTLMITPKIHADNTVTIRIMQENARVGLTQNIVYGDVSQGDFFETTDVQKQTITSTVVAKSGELVALGGLIHRSKEKDVASVPVLSDVPLVGALFERKTVNEVESELVVLIRPFVMLTPAHAERLSQSHLNRNATHPAAHDDSLSVGEDNPVRKENRSTRSRILEERIQVKSTPLDF